jgi:hypothetical protein
MAVMALIWGMAVMALIRGMVVMALIWENQRTRRET